jgi:hypothetical protein
MGRSISKKLRQFSVQGINFNRNNVIIIKLKKRSKLVLFMSLRDIAIGFTVAQISGLEIKCQFRINSWTTV